jgi:hypothetical protein
MAERCDIVGEFLGVRLPPCGGPATRVVVGGCERGHTRSRPVCEPHAEAFQADPQTVYCEQCDEAGAEIPMTLEVPDER